MAVNCMLDTTTRIGCAVGSTMRQKFIHSPAPSMRAALIRSPGKPTKQLRKSSDTGTLKRVCTTTGHRVLPHRLVLRESA